MSRKSAQQVAEESLEIRKEMSRLMTEEGLTETEALKKVLPEDKNRLTKLNLWKKHKLWPFQGDFSTDVVETVAPTVTPIINVSELPQDTVELFNQALIEFMKTQQNKQNEPSYRPRFKGERRQTSIRMPILMEKAAMDKAKECGDNKLTGGTIGGLVDLLLWRYLDSDDKFLGGPGDE